METDLLEVELLPEEIVPYCYGIFSCFEGGEPFVNEIVVRKWSDDGNYIWFMLESHNFYKAEVGKPITVLKLNRSYQSAETNEEFWAKRPTGKKEKCPTCGHESE